MAWGETEYIPIQGIVIATTDAAILLSFSNENEAWIPRSVIEDGDAVEEHDHDPNTAEWFCDKECLA